MAEIKKLVIIGGGFAGLRALYNLSDYDYHFEITMIDKSEYSLEKPALFGVALDGKDKQNVNIFLPPLLREHLSGYVNEEVESINTKKQKVILKNGEKVYYDYLILASGMSSSYNIKGFSEYAYSICSDNNAKKLYNAVKNFKGKSVSIVVPKNSVFDGVAAELAFRVKDKLKCDVNLFSQSSEFLSDLGEKSRKKTLKMLHKKGIEIVEDANVLEIGEDFIALADKSRVDSDLTIVFPELKVPEFVEKSSLKANEKGVLTNNNMQVKGFENIFSIGDLNAKEEPKLGFIALHQADVVSSFITNKENLEDAMETIEYNPEIFYVAEVDTLEGLLIYTNSKFGGKIDKAWLSPLAKFMKMGFSKEYYYTNGKLPTVKSIKRLEKILKSIS